MLHEFVKICSASGGLLIKQCVSSFPALSYFFCDLPDYNFRYEFFSSQSLNQDWKWFLDRSITIQHMHQLSCANLLQSPPPHRKYLMPLNIFFLVITADRFGIKIVLSVFFPLFINCDYFTREIDFSKKYCERLLISSEHLQSPCELKFVNWTAFFSLVLFWLQSNSDWLVARLTLSIKITQRNDNLMNALIAQIKL